MAIFTVLLVILVLGLMAVGTLIGEQSFWERSGPYIIFLSMIAGLLMIIQLMVS